MIPVATVARLAIAASAALVIGMAAAAGTRQSAVHAQPEVERAVYVLNAGVPQGVLVLNEFLPETVQVHRGDRVEWQITGPHNIHFVPQGETVERVGNLLDPTIEGDAVFTGGNANSGLQTSHAAFSLVMDLAPGMYAYQCDVHRGMHGTIEVLPASADIASPEQVAAQVAAVLAEQNPPTSRFASSVQPAATPIPASA